MKLIFQHSSKGQNKCKIPDFNCEEEVEIPEKLLRYDDVLPDVAEPEVVRHYNNLSKMNFGVDNGMYPLGSCTMKYNPKINERLSRKLGFTELHPLLDESCIQGALQIMYELSDYLCRISGFSQFTLAPAAGSHGELTGVMIIKKFFESTDEKGILFLSLILPMVQTLQLWPCADLKLRKSLQTKKGMLTLKS